MPDDGRHLPRGTQFLHDVLVGLGAERKSLPCKYFYDDRGSALFEQICELDEYYPTRTELGIMRGHAPRMADAIGDGASIVEYGSGSSLKTRILLESLHDPVACVLVDISREHLLRSAAQLARQFPNIEILPVAADFTLPFDLPRPRRAAKRNVVYFPGSTIGNFTHDQSRRFLAGVARQCGRDGGLLIGVDLDKDHGVLERAYNDARGVTAAFNLNLLDRINRELGADFDVDGFRHRAVYDPKAGRIEMLLVSTRPQTARVGGTSFAFDEGEAISTEYSHKYSLRGFAELAASAELRVRHVWTDEAELFSVQYLSV